MNLHISETDRGDELKTDLTGQVRARCELAKTIMVSNDYERARLALDEWCGAIGERPIGCDRLESPDKAELLLSTGALTAWAGTTGQLEGVLEKAKDLISESRTLFFDLGLPEKVGETQAELGHIYWQTGEYKEARVCLEDALMRLNDSKNQEMKAVAMIRMATLETSEGRFHDALNILTQAAVLFVADPRSKAGYSLKGRFHYARAVVLRNLGEREGHEDYTDRALIEYAAASYHFEQAGSIGWRASVENNLGYLYLVSGRHQAALKHIEYARELFEKMGDAGRIAQVDDTKAKVLLKLGSNRLFEAARVARRAVSALEHGDELALLAGALTTYGQVLARLGRYDRALESFHRANDAAMKAGNSERAGLARLTLVEELGEKMNAIELVSAYTSADELLADSRDAKILRRLRACAKMLAQAASNLSTDAGNWEVIINAERGCDLKSEVLRFEGSLIKRAWDVSGGVLNKTARLLGMSHQKLSEILNNRHQGLLSRKPRPKSFMQHPQRQRSGEKGEAAAHQE